MFDLLGVTFTGHPDLRRILMPEDWPGHPLRKDFVEPRGVPRHPDVAGEPAQGLRTMSLAGFEVEVQRAAADGGVVTEEMTLNMGPQHPSTHGVLRFVVRADGEVMKEAIPDIGYLHRSIEKIAEKVGWHGFMPYTDRVDYVAAMFCNHGWAMACEKLAGIEVPKRARVLPRDRRRAQPHRTATSCPSARWRWTSARSRRSRTRSASASTSTTSSRSSAARASRSTTCASAASAGTCRRAGSRRCAHFLDRFEPLIDEYDELISYNKIYTERLGERRGRSPPSEAIDYNLVGPNLRGSGVDYDVRRDVPYSVYPELEFDVPGRDGRDGHGRRLLRPLHRPHARDARELQDPPPVPRADPRGAGDREGGAQLQAAGGRRLRAARERARRHGLVRRDRRHGVSVSLQDPHGLVQRDQHHRSW